MPFQVFEAQAKSILSATTGFIAQAGFTHSLSPARNCTFGCTYCYVPTMRIYGGLQPADWKRWGQFTTFKSNAAEVLGRELRGDQKIYCSPLVDPYQPAESERQLMPALIEALMRRPPAVFSIQTRGPLILRDLDLLVKLAQRTAVRVSFSVTTNREQVRKLYEPHCAPIAERVNTIGQLRAAGIRTFATVAPILPCDPEELASIAIEATDQDLVGDPLHVRSVKPRGATTREAAVRLSERNDCSAWLDPDFQAEVVERIRAVATKASRRFGTGPEGFGWLAQ